MKPLLVFCITCIGTCNCYCQLDLTFQHITSEDGLTGEYNHYIKQDSYNELWISSIDGVFRYDGMEMMHYTPSSEDAPGMLGRNVQSDFFEDSKGNIWFTTYVAINKYNRNENRFEAFQLEDEEGNLIEADYDLFWLETDSILWLRAENNICTYNIYTKKRKDLYQSDYHSFSVQTDTLGHVTRIFASQMMGTDPLVILDIEQRKVIDVHFFQQRVNGQLFAFQSTFVQSDTLIWLCTDRGLIAVNPELLDNWHYFPLSVNNQDLEIRKALAHTEAKILLATQKNGIVLFDIRNNKYVNVTLASEGDSRSISYDEIRSIFLSSLDQQIWISYDKGKVIDYSWIYQNNFRDPLKASKYIFNANSIVSILEDKYGRIWNATKYDGIYLIDSSSFVSHIPIDRINGSLGRMVNLSQGINGNIWLVAANKVLLYNTNKKQWTNILLDDKVATYFLTHLSDQKKLISTDRGINEILFNDGEYQLTAAALFRDANEFDYFQIFQGDSGYHYTSKKGKYLVYNKESEIQKSHLIDGEIYGIYESDEHVTWIGSSNGLFQLNRKLDSISKFNLTIGNNTPTQIYGVQGDNQDRLWLATNQGIWCCFKEGGRCFVYTHYQDGTQFADFTPYASLKDSKGNIWFGTNEGLVVFHPDSIHPFPIAPRIKLKALWINNTPFTDIPNLDDLANLRLQHDQDDIEVRAIGVNQYFPKLNKIAYRLHHQDEQWQWLENGATFALPNLRPGTYQLDIKAMNLHGLEGEIRTLTIVVMSPFWLRWWFILASVITLIGLGFLVARAYVKRKLRKQQMIMERQQALQTERNRIARDLHDDLGWGLTTIQYISERLIRLVTPLEKNSSIVRINDYARELLDDMSDIIWIMDNEEGTLHDLLAQIESNAYELLELAEITHHITFQNPIPAMPLDRSWRRNTLLATKEVLRNIVKHAKARTVWFDLRMDRENIFLDIKDDGKGFDLNDIADNKSGRGVKNIKKRVAALRGEVTWTKNNGTLVKMIIPFPKQKA